jgi:hypothetical protein
MFEEQTGHERASEEANGRTSDQITPAQGDEVGGARPRADEVNGHGFISQRGRLAQAHVNAAAIRFDRLESGSLRAATLACSEHTPAMPAVTNTVPINRLCPNTADATMNTTPAIMLDIHAIRFSSRARRIFSTTSTSSII